MRVAYADPPYLGKCGLYQHEHGADGLCWDDESTHAALIARLCDEFADGWALSATSGTLRVLLPYCPDDTRVAVWVKPFVTMRPNVTPAYAWEPVLFRGGRRRTRDEWTGRDWVSAMPPVFSGECRAGVPGMKPETFCWWLFDDLLGLRAGDELVDLFHGSGAVLRAWAAYQRQRSLFGEPETVGAVDPIDRQPIPLSTRVADSSDSSKTPRAPQEPPA